MAPNNVFGEKADIMTPVPDETIARLADIEATRAFTKSFDRLSTTVDRQDSHLQKVDETLSDIRVFLAEFRKDAELWKEIRSDVSSLEARVTAIETTHAEQRGFAQAGTFASRVVPLLFGAAGVVYGFLSGKHP